MAKSILSMTGSYLLAIDPGASGAIAYFDLDEGLVGVDKMPETPKDLLLSIARFGQVARLCYLENVGQYVPGNSGPAAVKFAKHVGHLEMALHACAIPFHRVAPRTWQSIITSKPKRPKTTGLPKEEKQRKLAQYKRALKNRIKQQMQEVFPSIRVTLGIADALGILAYAIKKETSFDLTQRKEF